MHRFLAILVSNKTCSRLRARVNVRLCVCSPIPIMGRGTIQGDTLSPLLFIIYMEPLLRWLQEDRRTYRMKTIDEEVGPLAYADDLSVVTEDPQDAVMQAGK